MIVVESMECHCRRAATDGFDAEAPSSPDGSPDFLTTWIVDPDGNRIELVQWPPGHAVGMSSADWPDRADEETDDMSQRTAKEIVEEMIRLQQAGDDAALDLVAIDMVNHAAGPQGREGLGGSSATSTPTSGR